jgi:hypothetical protein
VKNLDNQFLMGKFSRENSTLTNESRFCWFSVGGGQAESLTPDSSPEERDYSYETGAGLEELNQEVKFENYIKERFPSVQKPAGVESGSKEGELKEIFDKVENKHRLLTL